MTTTFLRSSDLLSVFAASVREAAEDLYTGASEPMQTIHMSDEVYARTLAQHALSWCTDTSDAPKGRSVNSYHGFMLWMYDMTHGTERGTLSYGAWEDGLELDHEALPYAMWLGR